EPSIGGGGGGGRIALYFDTNNFVGVLQAHGGVGATGGGAGTVYSKANATAVGNLLVENGGRAGATTPLSGSVVYSVSVQNGAVLNPAKGITFESLLVGSNAWVSFSSPGQITVNGDLRVQPGGAMVADGAGYPGGQGPGAGGSAFGTQLGGGGGYGGFGSSRVSDGPVGGRTYGSFSQPSDPGSGGGNSLGSVYGSGGPGGGAIQLLVNGAFVVDGKISADGMTGIGAGSGGGSGGSIWLSAASLSGMGAISASGAPGNGYGGGGGGGRIALYLGTNDFAGAIKAWGSGTGQTFGGPGTIYTKIVSETVGRVVFDNGGNPGASVFAPSSPPVDLVLRRGVTVAPYLSATVRSLAIASNAWLLVTNAPFTVTDSAIIDEGGGITADGTGMPPGTGQGAGRTLPLIPPGGGTSIITGGGAGHGGYGASSSLGASGGLTYATPNLAAMQGSGGGGGNDPAPRNTGGAGGGVVRLIVSNVLTLNGRITANGISATNSNSGGGSGGSVWIDVATFLGTGAISADGGGGNGFGGGGGGGRVAINPATNLFGGTITAYGGAANTQVGGAGTVFFLRPDILTPASAPAELVLDNGGRSGTNSGLLGPLPLSLYRITFRGAASAGLASTMVVGNLEIGPNCWVFVSNRNSGFSVTGDATIQAGGGMRADGSGYSYGQGPGAGRSYSSMGVATGGGGGYGGFGARGSVSLAYGGNCYGTLAHLTEMGSGGAMGGGTNYGGSGGGYLGLRVDGRLLLDGTLSANGSSGLGQNSGGGSGGTLVVLAMRFEGTGSISANGGTGPGLGGGGGGGRINIYILPGGSNLFAGNLTAFGGPGFNRGGAGTVQTVFNDRPSITSLLIDNGGSRGTNTVITGAYTTDVIVQGGGVLSKGFDLPIPSLHNLLIRSNSALILSDQPLTISGNVTVQAGGEIIADGTGYPADQGPGGGRGIYQGAKGGGGYGGMGGANASGGGQTYGAFMPGPLQMGSGGASGSGSSFAPLGGAGGGMIRLAMSTVSTLLLDGRISANGGPGDQNSGGGSGGSVWITTGTLVGAGFISADGGAGSGIGGGGGGGRIAIESRSNLLTGPITAVGGTGSARGGAGTVYLRPLPQNIGQVVIDNGGFPGRNSSLGLSGSFPVDLTVRNGASLSPAGQVTVQNLSLMAGGWITFSNRASDSLAVSRDALIDTTSGISADGTGYAAAQGPGRGTTLGSPYGNAGSGGGHAGFGGVSIAGNPGGTAYDTVAAPSMGGSGGGTGQGTTPSNLGGAGGGIVNFSVGGNLVNDGRISAEGLSGVGQNSGGGSGGTVSLIAGILSGSGVISANGGMGNGLGGGGGGGGCIRILCSSNQFAGTVSAFGASGVGNGGAGTLYTTTNVAAGGELTIDNNGQPGTNTPLSLLSPLNLYVQNGASVCPASDYLVLGNLVVGEAGVVTCIAAQSTLDLTVLGNTFVASNALISVDAKGFARATGPGAGLSTNDIGSGAGYGAQGGSSSMLPGGAAYGSAERPVDFGSGGGSGYGTLGAGSEGGGALRLSVGGTLTLDGTISANGNHGLQDNAGGGSGGSVLILAHTLDGAGIMRANGGAGEVFQGGGGAGGRIALYARTNNFTGEVVASGAPGWAWGEGGTIFASTNFEAPFVMSHSPTGIVYSGVFAVDLVFNMPMSLASVDTSAFVLETPLGKLDPADVAVRSSGASTLRFSFSLLSAVGDYALKVGPGLASDIFGQPLSQSYTGSFTISLPLIQGVVTDTNGQPVPGVLMQPSIGSPAVTDTNGAYAIGAAPGLPITVTPSFEGLVFVPGSRSYTSVSESVTNQDYLAVPTLIPIVTWQPQEKDILLTWTGIPGVSYQVFYSANLVNWVPFWGPVTGTNGLMQYTLPIYSDPCRFYRLGASN
ncbi:MAG TPA: hypothetical protein VJA21_31060, partial [Verrucomicrobiae bacterium]